MTVYFYEFLIRNEFFNAMDQSYWIFFVIFMYWIISVFIFLIFKETRLNFPTIVLSLTYLTIRIAHDQNLAYSELLRAISFMILTLVIFFGIL